MLNIQNRHNAFFPPSKVTTTNMPALEVNIKTELFRKMKS